ncbi:MAG TPA: DNA alkylation repair protein [Actinomycetota bacterium]
MTPTTGGRTEPGPPAQAAERCRAVLAELRAVADASRLPGMARVGIATDRALGVPIPTLRRVARTHRGDHQLALALWTSGVHEARILASMIDDPAQVTAEQMEAWVAGLDSWDVCDQVTGNLFTRTAAPMRTARAWAARTEPFVRRAGFAMLAELAHRDRASSDTVWERQLPLIRRAATDERNAVMKAVSWALRQIGKRNAHLNERAIAEAEELLALDSRGARWIARDALRELRSDAVRERLRGG